MFHGRYRIPNFGISFETDSSFFFFNQQQNLAAEEHSTTFFQHMGIRYQGDLNFEHMDILESSSFCTSDM